MPGPVNVIIRGAVNSWCSMIKGGFRNHLVQLSSGRPFPCIRKTGKCMSQHSNPTTLQSVLKRRCLLEGASRGLATPQLSALGSLCRLSAPAMTISGTKMFRDRNGISREMHTMNPEARSSMAIYGSWSAYSVYLRIRSCSVFEGRAAIAIDVFW